MTINLDPLPYSKDSLHPYISEETLTFHHEKHHKGYCDILNDLIKETEFENLTLDEIVIKSSMDETKAAIFNNAAQVWNHNFYFKCMHPNGGDEPLGDLLTKIEENFNSFDNFKTEFKLAAKAQFGSGWVWLVLNETHNLKIVKTPNAANPLTNGLKPILVLDVWEHAYYLDYQNRRMDYVDVFLSKLINWAFVAENISNAN